MEIREKIKKDEEILIQLKEKKEKINEKISKIEERIQKNKIILNDIKFNEIDSVISAKGLSIDEILQAVKNGDLLSIQDKLMQKEETQDQEGKQKEIENNIKDEELKR